MEGIQGWVMVILTFIFLALYASALLGWLRPVSDVTMITRLEPLIFVIIGYYFGRLPSESTEHALALEMDRRSKLLEACQFSKEAVEKERDVAEEKARNVRTILCSPSADLENGGDPQYLTAAVRTVVQIIDS